MGYRPAMMVVFHVERGDHHHQHHDELTDDHRRQRHGGRGLAENLAGAPSAGILFSTRPGAPRCPHVRHSSEFAADLPRVRPEADENNHGTNERRAPR